MQTALMEVFSFYLTRVILDFVIREWRAPSGKGISVVGGNPVQLVCAAGSELYYLEIGKGVLHQLG